MYSDMLDIHILASSRQNPPRIISVNLQFTASQPFFQRDPVTHTAVVTLLVSNPRPIYIHTSIYLIICLLVHLCLYYFIYKSAGY